MATQTRPDLDEFLAKYAEDHQIVDINVNTTKFIVVRHGDRAIVLNPMAFPDHLCVDAHAFVDGKPATTGVFGMSDGRRHAFDSTGTTSHGFNSDALIALLVGKQGEVSR